MIRKRLSLLVALGAVLVSCVAVAPAAAAPVLNLDIHHNETNIPPGGNGQYWFNVANVGGTATEGPTFVTVNFPPGLSFAALREHFDPVVAATWFCPSATPGDTSVLCGTFQPIPRHSVSRKLVLLAQAEPGASGVLDLSAKLEGGGAAQSVTETEPTRISDQPAGFGILDSSFTPDFTEADGSSPVRHSGAHPDLFTVPFDFTSIISSDAEPEQKVPAGNARSLHVDLPPGFIGNPSAVAECEPAELAAYECPASSQVGRIDLSASPLSENGGILPVSTGVFNLVPSPGVAAELGFIFSGRLIHIRASLDPSRGYAINSTVPYVNESLPVFDQKLTLWGIPADGSHDSERCPAFKLGQTEDECDSESPRRAFITLPSSCTGDDSLKLHDYDSWQQPNVFGPPITAEIPGQIDSCSKPEFEPSATVKPTTTQADAPTGLDVKIDVPQNENPNTMATPPVKSIKVVLPQGMTVSPTFADGAGGCTEAQLRLGTNDPVSCPDTSRIGNVTLSTPILRKPVEGSMYLAPQGENPFRSTFAVYVVLHDTEDRGVLIKSPGRLDLNPATGQITTSFDDLPQFPFESLSLNLRSGARAPLISSPSCGAQAVGVQMASYARPNDPVDVSSTYVANQGPGGTACPVSLAARPFAPGFSAGTINPNAGSYSPFLLRLDRQDPEQEMSRIAVTLPEGLSSRIAQVPYCPESALISISGAEGTGRAELANPSCPAASQLGTVSTSLGAGPEPKYFPGRVYLGGPYKGAPLSLAIVVPAVAGPYDFGSVLVRSGVGVDPVTAQITATSDPIPTILHGVLLRIRDIRLSITRQQTTVNPTSCAPKVIGGQAISVYGQSAPLAARFQALGCRALDFKPRLRLRLFGGVRRAKYQGLRAVVRAKPGDANIGRAVVRMPRTAFVAQEHLNNICTRVQFRADACPKGSVYGRAIAYSPLLGFPLRGKVYLRSSDDVLPNLVADLRGPRNQPIRIELAGRIDSVKGALRTTFDYVPDAPVSYFRMQLAGGEKGLIINSKNICGKNFAGSRFDGHNGRRTIERVQVSSRRCGLLAKKRRARRRRQVRRARRSADASVLRGRLAG